MVNFKVFLNATGWFPYSSGQSFRESVLSAILEAAPCGGRRNLLNPAVAQVFLEAPVLRSLKERSLNTSHHLLCSYQVVCGSLFFYSLSWYWVWYQNLSIPCFGPCSLFVIRPPTKVFQIKRLGKPFQMLFFIFSCKTRLPCKTCFGSPLQKHEVIFFSSKYQKANNKQYRHCSSHPHLIA